MQDKYDSITEVLKNDKNLSMELITFPMSAGVKNIRVAMIFEPNPDKGKTAGYGDQEYILGSTRVKNPFEVYARDAIESLDLLALKCAGEKDVKNTVSYRPEYIGPSKNVIHGYNVPKAGLDSRLFTDFRLIIQKQENDLVATMKNDNFYGSGMIISSKPVENVDEAITLYEDNPQDVSILNLINKGSVVNTKLQKYVGFNNFGKPSPEISNAVTTQEFLRKYDNALTKLVPLNITDSAEGALFIGMLLREFYVNK
jgi:hypothetical protein